VSKLRTVAALYCDPRGPYGSMPGVDMWDEARDARLYDGPHPVVAHPPCGPWSKMARFCTKQDASLGPVAVRQVRTFGGILEHPAYSRLWNECGLPRPGVLDGTQGSEFSIAVEQYRWGHRCVKPTWLFMVRVDPREVFALRRIHVPAPTNAIRGGKKDNRPGIGHLARRLTPPAFAEWLVQLARSVQ